MSYLHYILLIRTDSFSRGSSESILDERYLVFFVVPHNSYIDCILAFKVHENTSVFSLFETYVDFVQTS